ncbi:hypothetical protein D3C75_535450 [compost metagenome]
MVIAMANSFLLRCSERKDLGHCEPYGKFKCNPGNFWNALPCSQYPCEGFDANLFVGMPC